MLKDRKMKICNNEGVNQYTLQAENFRYRLCPFNAKTAGRNMKNSIK